MKQRELKELFDLCVSPCLEAVEWASKQEDQSVGGLLAACERPEWKEFIAQYSRSAAILERLAEDENCRVRGKVARNPNTSAVVLEELAKDEDGWAREGVARNPSTPTVILEVLAKDKNGWVRVSAVR